MFFKCYKTLPFFIIKYFALVISAKSLLNNVQESTNSNKWSIAGDASFASISICYSIKQNDSLNEIPSNQTGVYPKNQLPTRGPHYPDWGRFGEYSYLPPEVFIHNLVLGDVVFLYHPCAPNESLELFKTLARNCTWRHVISSYSSVLNKTYPFGILTYGCEYRTSSINTSDIQHFMRNRLKSPISSAENGNYTTGLLVSSHPPGEAKERNDDNFCKDVTNLILKRTSVSTNSSFMKTPRTEEAAWAAGSLVFLLSCLTCAVCYTKLWKRGSHGQNFERSRVWNDETDPGSVSVAAIVRKFPHMLKNKVNNTRRWKLARDTHYRPLINEEESYSEDEV